MWSLLWITPNGPVRHVKKFSRFVMGVKTDPTSFSDIFVGTKDILVILTRARNTKPGKVRASLL